MKPGAGKGSSICASGVQAVLPLGPHDLADPMVLEMSVADWDAVWSL